MDSSPQETSLSGRHYVGHQHFWERAFSRRQFMSTAAGAGAVALSSSLWLPGVAEAAESHLVPVAPKPIPGGIQPFGPGTEVFHVFLPGPANEPATITDFHGTIGLADITGAGTARIPGTDTTFRLTFETDTRFLQGTYIGVDGKRHRGTFGFI